MRLFNTYTALSYEKIYWLKKFFASWFTTSYSPISYDAVLSSVNSSIPIYTISGDVLNTAISELCVMINTKSLRDYPYIARVVELLPHTIELHDAIDYNDTSDKWKTNRYLIASSKYNAFHASGYIGDRYWHNFGANSYIIESSRFSIGEFNNMNARIGFVSGFSNGIIGRSVFAVGTNNYIGGSYVNVIGSNNTSTKWKFTLNSIQQKVTAIAGCDGCYDNSIAVAYSIVLDNQLDFNGDVILFNLVATSSIDVLPSSINASIQSNGLVAILTSSFDLSRLYSGDLIVSDQRSKTVYGSGAIVSNEILSMWKNGNKLLSVSDSIVFGSSMSNITLGITSKITSNNISIVNSSPSVMINAYMNDLFLNQDGITLSAYTKSTNALNMSFSNVGYSIRRSAYSLEYSVVGAGNLNESLTDIVYNIDSLKYNNINNLSYGSYEVTSLRGLDRSVSYQVASRHGQLNVTNYIGSLTLFGGGVSIYSPILNATTTKFTTNENSVIIGNSFDTWIDSSNGHVIATPSNDTLGFIGDWVDGSYQYNNGSMSIGFDTNSSVLYSGNLITGKRVIYSVYDMVSTMQGKVIHNTTSGVFPTYFKNNLPTSPTKVTPIYDEYGIPIPCVYTPLSVNAMVLRATFRKVGSMVYYFIDVIIPSVDVTSRDVVFMYPGSEFNSQQLIALYPSDNTAYGRGGYIEANNVVVKPMLKITPLQQISSDPHELALHPIFGSTLPSGLCLQFFSAMNNISSPSYEGENFGMQIPGNFIFSGSYIAINDNPI